MVFSRFMWRGLFPVVATIWAWLMLVVGLLLILDWSASMPALRGGGALLGVGLLALGQFVGAVVADRLFPRADRRVAMVFEIAAWAVMGGALVLWCIGLAGGGPAAGIVGAG